MSKWISVKDRLPKPADPRGEQNVVLAWFEEDQMRSGVKLAHIRGGHWAPINGHGNFDDEVTHWMPLPKRPK